MDWLTGFPASWGEPLRSAIPQEIGDFSCTRFSLAGGVRKPKLACTFADALWFDSPGAQEWVLEGSAPLLIFSFLRAHLAR